MIHNCRFKGNETVAAASPSGKQTDKQLKGAVGTKAPVEVATISLLFSQSGQRPARLAQLGAPKK